MGGPPGFEEVAALPRHEATDGTGSVRVSVDACGRVVEVDIGRTWRSRLGVEGLTTALFETYSVARQQALETLSPAHPAASPPHPAASPVGRGAESRPLDALRARLDRVQITRDRMARFDGDGTREHTGRHGLLTATVRGGAVIGVVSGSRGIWYADTEQLRQDALEVLSCGEDYRADAGRS